jgi:hypothetical protein
MTMTLTRRGKRSYGTEQNDIVSEIGRYSKASGYIATHFASASCVCGGVAFRLALDETVGAAVRTCSRCNKEHAVGDSADFLGDAELEECACPCGNEEFEVVVGVALYADSEDVRWLYLGCRCPTCGLTAVYGDWKNEFNGFQTLLDRV